MPLTRSIDDLEDDVRFIADCDGTTGVERHSQANVFNLLNRGIGELHRELTALIPDQRVLGSTTVSITSGTAEYALPSDFYALISLYIEANGERFWPRQFQPSERSGLTNPQDTYTGIPYAYRIEAANIEFLPISSGSYTAKLYYAPNPSTLTTGQALDTVVRLDSYPVWYAAKEIAKRDRLWDLHDRCTADMVALRQEIATVARSRDRNESPRVAMGMHVDRFGRAR
jgi:hypothetical protein